MTRIYMIRHGKAAAGWDSDADPGLDDLGRAQSRAVAEKMQQLVSAPAPIFSSPLKRCQQTAMPLAEAWGVTPQIESGVGEIPPPLDDLTDRTDWLRRVMAGSWQELYHDATSLDSGIDFKGWYDGVPRALHNMTALGDHVVVFSHFIALNVAYCAATGAHDVVSFAPQNGSLNIFDTDGQTLSLVALGEETEDIKIALGKR